MQAGVALPGLSGQRLRNSLAAVGPVADTAIARKRDKTLLDFMETTLARLQSLGNAAVGGIVIGAGGDNLVRGIGD
jgi:hypothetical protein